MSTSGGIITATPDPALVSTGTAQGFTEAQKAVGLKNLGTVRIVEPEQYAGATDDVQFYNACLDVSQNGGVVRLRPGKTYTWVNAPTTFDFSATGQWVIVEAWGAIINANVPGASWTLKKSTSGSTTNTIMWMGGVINNNHAAATDVFLLQDMNKTFWFRVEANCPNGSAWHQSNVTGFSENNHYVECYDPGSKHAFTASMDGSLHGSMARTVWRGLRVQGGVAWEPKFNVGDGTALYHGILDGMTGNLAINAVGIRVSGNMHGFVIQGNIGMENSNGTPGTDYAYYFTVGTMLGGVLPELHTDIVNLAPTPPAGNTLTMQLVAPTSAPNTNPSTQDHLYGALTLMPGVLGVGSEVAFDLPNASPVALTASTETTVFTINVTPGEYVLDAQMTVQITTASSVANLQGRINGGTATYTVAGPSSTQTSTASAANVQNQTTMLRVRGHLVVTAAGTVIVTARASSAATVASTTPGAGYGNSSGYGLLQVA